MSTKALIQNIKTSFVKTSHSNKETPFQARFYWLFCPENGYNIHVSLLELNSDRNNVCRTWREFMSFDIEVIVEKPLLPNRKMPSMAEIPAKNYFNCEEISYFYFDEYSRLISQAIEFYQLIYLLLFETGARIQEARAIRFRDLERNPSRIAVKTSKQRGIKKTRFLTISDRLKGIILDHQIDHKLDKNDFVLAWNPGGRAITQQSIDYRMKQDCKLAGIARSKAHCHTWRHTRAIQLLDAGMNIVQLQKFLGHSSLQSTLIYLKYSDQHLSQAIRKGNEAINLI